MNRQTTTPTLDSLYSLAFDILFPIDEKEADSIELIIKQELSND